MAVWIFHRITTASDLITEVEESILKGATSLQLGSLLVIEERMSSVKWMFSALDDNRKGIQL